MTYTEISTMLKEAGIPTAYYQFDESTGQQPPFICFYYQSDDDFHADNVNYAKIRVLKVELYTDEKDFALEEALEGVLASHGISYGRQETYIDSERMHEVIYTSEVLVTPEADGTDTDTDSESEEGENEQG